MLSSEQRISRFRPTLEDELLLKALFLSGSKADESYRIWRRIVDIDDFSPGNHNLLPLLYSRREISQDDFLANIAKGVHRRTVYTNSMHFRDAAGVIELFNEAGIPVLLLKGAALTRGVYPELGLRPMRDVDIAIAPSRLSEALRILFAAGWDMPARKANSLGSVVLAKHGEEFVFKTGTTIDLHWNIFYASRQNQLDEQDWQTAVSAQFFGQSVKVLAPEEQFLHIAIHGISYLAKFQIRWIADAMSLLEKHQLDWERVILLARQRRLQLQIKDVLHYLRREFDVPVPDSVLTQLDTEPECPKAYVLYSYYSWPQYPQEYLLDASRYRSPLNTVVRSWREYCLSDWTARTDDELRNLGRAEKFVGFLYNQFERRSERVPRRYR